LGYGPPKLVVEKGGGGRNWKREEKVGRRKGLGGLVAERKEGGALRSKVGVLGVLGVFGIERGL
jgi:hypothetical protein